MTPAKASSVGLELLALLSRLDPVEVQLAEGRPYAASQSVAMARDALRRLADEMLADAPHEALASRDSWAA